MTDKLNRCAAIARRQLELTNRDWSLMRAEATEEDKAIARRLRIVALSLAFPEGILWKYSSTRNV